MRTIDYFDKQADLKPDHPILVDGETRYPFAMRSSYLYGSVRLADPYVPLNPGATSTTTVSAVRTMSISS